MVTTVETTTQVWRFDCPRCGDSWTEIYEHRDATDARGAHGEYYGLDGTPTMPPQAAALCRSCGYFFVKSRLVGGSD